MVGAELGDPGVADALEQGDRLGELAGGLVRQARLSSVVRVSGWSGPSLAIWASRTRSSRAIASGSLPAAWYATAEVVERGQGVGVVGAELGDLASRTRSNSAIASGSLPAAWYAMARLLSVVRVSGWSGPSLAIWASRTRSNRAIASGSLPADWYALARLSSVVRVSGWSGPSLAICGVADALEQGDRLGELAGFPVRQGEIVERGAGCRGRRGRVCVRVPWRPPRPSPRPRRPVDRGGEECARVRPEPS